MGACTLSVNVSHITVNESAHYRFAIVYEQVLRNRTEVRVVMPDTYAVNNLLGGYRCWVEHPLVLLNS